VTPMWQLDRNLPKLMLGSSIPDFPGNVGLLAAASGTEHVGIRTSRLFVEDFAKHGDYAGALAAFLETGSYPPPRLHAIDVSISAAARSKAGKVKNSSRE